MRACLTKFFVGTEGAKILAALEQPTELSFHQTPLQAAVDFLMDKSQGGNQRDGLIGDGDLSAGISVAVSGTGVTVETDVASMQRGIAALGCELDRKSVV